MKIRYVIAGFCVALIVHLILELTPIDRFLDGWISCIAYYFTVESLEDFDKRSY